VHVTQYEDYNRIPEPDEPKVRKSAIMRVFGWLLGWAIILGGLGFAALAFGWMAFTAPGPLNTAKTLDIQKGLNRSQIAALLESSGIVSDARIFSTAAAANSIRGRYIKPGEYEFPASATMQDVLATVLSGKVISYKLTIPEGWTTEMAVARLKENEVLTGEVTAMPPEGALIANTQVFTRGTTRQELIDTMRTAQDKLLDEVWATKSADLPLKSKTELLTLASIIEKETGKADERPQVAAVFLNRLKQGLKLQSDPTIIYGLVGGKGKLERPLTRADVDGATPYNTYVIPGLPPGPIASPGRDALMAVMKPAPVNYLYFVADGTGGHAFATTLDEHNANVAKWRKIEDAPPPQPAVETKMDAEGALAAVPLEPPVEPPAAPVEPAATATPETTPQPEPAVVDNEPVLDLKPGAVIRVGAKLIPIPAERRPRTP
jgi:UPF0755 protein